MIIEFAPKKLIADFHKWAADMAVRARLRQAPPPPVEQEHDLFVADFSNDARPGGVINWGNDKWSFYGPDGTRLTQDEWLKMARWADSPYRFDP